MKGIKPAGKIAILIFIAIIVFAVYKTVAGKGGKPGSGPDPEGGILGRPLRVGVVYWPGYAGGIVANGGFAPNKESIFWKKYQLKVEFVDIEDPDAANKAFAKGGPDGVDIVWSTVDYWANNYSNLAKGGLKAKAIMQVDWSQGGDAIVADSSIKRAEDLAGKKIAIVKYTPSHWLLESCISRLSSISPEDQKRIMTDLVDCPGEAEARDAFTQKKVPACVIWEPFVTEALKNRPGSHVLITSAQASHTIADLMVAQDSFIQSHPDVVQAFVSGWMEGAEEANRDTAKAVKLLMDNEPPYKAAGEDATRDGLSKVRLATIADNTEMFGLDGKQTPAFDRIYKDSGEAWLRRQYITNLVAVADAKNDNFVRQYYATNPPPPPPPPVDPDGTVLWNQKKLIPLGTKHVTINFPPGVGALDASACAALDKNVVSVIKDFAGAYFRIEGNTDNIGSRDDNVRLSLRRAQAVVDYLGTKGIDKKHLIPAGNGPDKPIASNGSDAGRAQNRRTDIVAFKRN